MNADPTIIELSIVEVEAGGNAGGGAYEYAFSQRVLLCTAKGEIQIRLNWMGPNQFKIYAVATSASQGQFEIRPIEQEGKQAVIINHCTRPELINLAVVVQGPSK
ncbi:hypothetical protein JTP67_31355, partial [Streptomyces sp. S12]|nr:hypothetical protein [Streptomyces sp. S12]